MNFPEIPAEYHVYSTPNGLQVCGDSRDVYLLLYPKPPLAKQLAGKPALLRAIWHALNRIAPEDLMGEGRVYGGGLHKLEPNELGNASAVGLCSVLPDLRMRHAAQRTLFCE